MGDLNLDPQNPCKKASPGGHTCNLSARGQAELGGF